MGNNFLFISENLISSTAGYTVMGHSGGASFTQTAFSSTTFNELIDRDRYDLFKMSQTAFTTYSIYLTFTSAVVANMLCLQNINFKNYYINLNGALMTLTSNETATAIWANNSETSKFLEFATQTVNSLEIRCNAPIVSTDDFEIGQMILGLEQYELPRNPAFADYKPALSGQHIAKKMADKGYVTYKVADKFGADIKLNFVPASATAELLTMYNTISAWNFCPFATHTAWDGDIWEMNWIGDYQFKQMARGERGTPLYKGVMKLRETPV